ncbi:TM2 domain-containing protein [Mycoplasmopsis cricetuli]|uniref:TM2 domain-containing protein n=1 Tax=Mycoplasmopsis cricetuli TaxID=171283 RepID=UPI00046F6305|nr:TM2 domain-containing protein [Mycoplasmopsis cricetuli]
MSNKSRIVLILLSFFLGYLGIDRFYAGRVWLGLFKLFTGGLFGVWYFIDFILAVCGQMRDSDGQKISKL